MKLSKRDKGILLALLGILLAVASYVLVYTPTVEKHEALKRELAQLQNREAQLVELEQKMPYYKEQIVVCQERVDELVVFFPAQIKPENEIMYAVELENELELDFSTLNYGTPMEFMATTNNAGLTAYNTPLSMNFRGTYQGLKDVVEYTKAQQDRKVVDTVTAAYDGVTGQLVGTMTINMYTIEGTEKMYEAPYVPSMNFGVDNIFGTFEGTGSNN